MIMVKSNFYHFFGICLVLTTLLNNLTACSNTPPRPDHPAPLEQINPAGSTALPGPTPAVGTIRYAVFPAPPYMIGAGNASHAMSGIDVEIVMEIARRLQYKIEVIKCPWARCLDLLKNGEADLLSSVYKKPEREAFMLYFDQPYLNQLPIAFYSLKEKHYLIQKYEDIYQFGHVGLLKGASYFDRFDQDPRVKRVEVPSQDQLFPMLLAGHLDIIAGYVPTENYRLKVEGYSDQIERSTYQYDQPEPVYMTISKKSPLIVSFDKINQVNSQLIKEGVVDRIVNSYYDQYR
jgi:polar amino acid transport system substrate-binding protein